MIWIFVGILMGMLLYWALIGRHKDDNFRIIEILNVMLVGILIFFGGNGLTAYFTIPKYSMPEEYQLANLHDDTLTEGFFFLGTGSINEERCVFYRYEEDGGWKLDSVEADLAIIYEEERSDGELIIYKPTLLSWFWSIYYDDRYEFYIPEGSIIREYEVR